MMFKRIRCPECGRDTLVNKGDYYECLTCGYKWSKMMPKRQKDPVKSGTAQPLVEQYQDFPFAEVVEAGQRLAEEGKLVHQKYTCDQCHTRLTIEVANAFYREAACDKCGFVTNIEKKGCNYLLII